MHDSTATESPARSGRMLGIITASGTALLIAVALLAHFAGIGLVAPLTLALLAVALLLAATTVVVVMQRQGTSNDASGSDAGSATRESELATAGVAPELARARASLERPQRQPTLVPDGDKTGIVIGKYTLEERVAAGGMGEVWRASHETLIRPTALKLVRHPGGENKLREAEWIERFRREAIITGNLSSPHTVELYDFGVEGKTLYLAMELLEGMEIRTMVERYGPLGDARAAFLLRQACHSLIDAHESGIVHRDIKPENLFVAKVGRDADFLKVIDFGLVKELAKGPGKARSLTGTAGGIQLTAIGARPGTPGYMAPEQIDGSAVDQRADIYALACVAYFALTGQPVFEGSQEAQLMFAHVEVEPMPPSERAQRSIHQGLEDVVMRCLSKNPLKRPPTMLALDDALAELTFPEPWSQAKAREWWKQPKKVSAD